MTPLKSLVSDGNHIPPLFFAVLGELCVRALVFKVVLSGDDDLGFKILVS
jgi:hypothetical protein